MLCLEFKLYLESTEEYFQEFLQRRVTRSGLCFKAYMEDGSEEAVEQRLEQSVAVGKKLWGV